MKTLFEIVRLSSDHLASRGVSQPRLQAEELVAAALGLKRLDLYLQFECPLDEKELAECRALLERRARREPLQHILGTVDFLDCTLEVTPDVLIPRPETEQLAEKIIGEIEPKKTLWDLCCGSGCLGIAIKKAHPELQVICSDLSPEALAVAQRNAQANEVEIEFRQGDLLAPFAGEMADYIVSNPPYVATHELPLLEPEVRDFDPEMALISGPSGLEIYERLAPQIMNYLQEGGKIWFEIGSSQGPALSQLFPQGEVQLDWSGRERFFSLEKQALES